MNRYGKAMELLLAAALLIGLLGACGKQTDPPAGSAEAPSVTEDAPQTASAKEPLEAAPYVEFYARRLGIGPEEIDLSRAVLLTHRVQGEETGFPLQYIRTPEAVEAAARILESIRVTGGSDGIMSTGVSESLSLLGEDGKEILGISVQDGMIETSDGRFPAEGLGELAQIPGLKYEEDWLALFDAQTEAEAEYLAAYEPDYPAPVMEVRGKRAADFFRDCTAADLNRVYIIYGSNGVRVEDRADIERIYNALCDIRITGTAEPEALPEHSWSILLECVVGENTFEDEIQFRFYGSAFAREEELFTAEGVEALLDAYDCEQFASVREDLGS